MSLCVKVLWKPLVAVITVTVMTVMLDICQRGVLPMWHKLCYCPAQNVWQDLPALLRTAIEFWQGLLPRLILCCNLGPAQETSSMGVHTAALLMLPAIALAETVKVS